MWDDPVAVVWRSLGVPHKYPTPPACYMGKKEDCRVQASPSPPLLTPSGLNKGLGVFRAGSMLLSPGLNLVWDLETLKVVSYYWKPTTRHRTSKSLQGPLGS